MRLKRGGREKKGNQGAFFPSPCPNFFVCSLGLIFQPRCQTIPGKKPTWVWKKEVRRRCKNSIFFPPFGWQKYRCSRRERKEEIKMVLSNGSRNWQKLLLRRRVASPQGHPKQKDGIQQQQLQNDFLCRRPPFFPWRKQKRPMIQTKKRQNFLGLERPKATKNRPRVLYKSQFLLAINRNEENLFILMSSIRELTLSQRHEEGFGTGRRYKIPGSGDCLLKRGDLMFLPHHKKREKEGELIGL